MDFEDLVDLPFPFAVVDFELDDAGLELFEEELLLDFEGVFELDLEDCLEADLVVVFELD